MWRIGRGEKSWPGDIKILFEGYLGQLRILAPYRSRAEAKVDGYCPQPDQAATFDYLMAIYEFHIYRCLIHRARFISNLLKHATNDRIPPFRKIHLTFSHSAPLKSIDIVTYFYQSILMLLAMSIDFSILSIVYFTIIL